jgi:hypothetical protein
VQIVTKSSAPPASAPSSFDSREQSVEAAAAPKIEPINTKDMLLV